MYKIAPATHIRTYHLKAMDEARNHYGSLILCHNLVTSMVACLDATNLTHPLNRRQSHLTWFSKSSHV